MTSYIPVILDGSNLKQRQRYLNAFVRKAYEENVLIEEIINIEENSVIDRIFKIDLASKYKYTDYILQNLKDDDMLFVSRSLKSLWLLENEYHDVINPTYLENTLYPEMIQPAVNKMKHWLQLNLKDPERCHEFYHYYKDDIDYAINFFWHCSQEFILSDLPNIIDRFTPSHLNILFEICPAACKLYFEILPNNSLALQRYVNDVNYFTSIKYALKYDGPMVLDIVEKYFNISKFRPFGPSLTKTIMKGHKSRALNKIEFYASSVLHVKTLAHHINSEEAKQIISQLARAEFLNNWFTFQKIDPLLKRVKIKERTLLKQQLFVDREIKSVIKDWPYPVPIPLQIEEEEEEYPFISDTTHRPEEYYYWDFIHLKRSRNCKYGSQMVTDWKSPLDKLFDRYRFVNFKNTYQELTKNLLAEGSIDGRLNIMLVLVSKSGGVSEQVEKLLRFLVQRHINEPHTLRVAVIRSLVKRECVWRVKDEVWDLLLKFGWDIGLDGSTTDLVCREGLHAVIIRHLLNNISIERKLLLSFIESFSTLSEYKLSTDEKAIIAKRLPQILFALNPRSFLNCLAEYNLSIDEFPEAKLYLINAAKEDPNLVHLLFNAKKLRRELLRETFNLIQTDDMYVNVLRHDTDLLERGKMFATIPSKKRPNHDRFLRYLALYFNEPGGLADQHRIIFKKAIQADPQLWFVHPLCVLLPTQSLFDLPSELCHIEMFKDKIKTRTLAAIQSNLHKSKPALDIDKVEWRLVGVTTIANKVFICRAQDREKYLRKLLEEKRTARICLQMSLGTNLISFSEVFLNVCTLRPSSALKIGLKLLFTKNILDLSIWDALKSIIKNIKDMSKTRQVLLEKLLNPKSVPRNIETDYWMLVFNIIVKIDKTEAMPILCRLENLLPLVDKSFVANIIKDFINNKPDKFPSMYDFILIRSLYFRIIVKYLLLSQTEQEQFCKLENVCEKLFDAIEVLYQKEKSEVNLKTCKKTLEDFLRTLKYTISFLGDYVTQVPVFERVLKRLHNILPVIENFDTYANIHLTMLYYTAIEQAMKIEPGLFKNTNNCKQGIEVLGEIFGRFIGQEITELNLRYFRSVVDIYKNALYQYLLDGFVRNKSWNIFVTFVIKGILQSKTVEAYILAEHIFQQEHCKIDEIQRTEIFNIFKNSSSKEVNFFFYAHYVRNTYL